MDVVSLIGNISSVIGLVFSIWVFVRTGKIQDSIKETLEREKKILNYNNNRIRILDGINECASYLINELTEKEQHMYIQKLDSCLADLHSCYPSADNKIIEKIEGVRAALTNKHFSYIAISPSINDITSILRQEGYYYHD